MDKYGIVFAGVGIVAVAVVIGFFISFPLMLLWNYCLVPAVPTIQEVGWLQMWGIFILCNFLFKTSTAFKKE